jgi:hypothetical protein
MGQPHRSRTLDSRPRFWRDLGRKATGNLRLDSRMSIQVAGSGEAHDISIFTYSAEARCVAVTTSQASSNSARAPDSEAKRRDLRQRVLDSRNGFRDDCVNRGACGPDEQVAVSRPFLLPRRGRQRAAVEQILPHVPQMLRPLHWDQWTVRSCS